MKSYKTTNSARYKFATRTIRAAGQLAMSYFDNLSQLKIEKKGHQDLVSEADKTVEIFLREQIIHQFSNDIKFKQFGGLTDHNMEDFKSFFNVMPIQLEVIHYGKKLNFVCFMTK